MPRQSLQQLQKQAHDNNIAAGEKLIEAEDKLSKAESLLQEANIRMSNARKFESILKKRQEKLDKAFVLLNRERTSIQQRQFRADQHDLMLEENLKQY